jgi:hypothetical protein
MDERFPIAIKERALKTHGARKFGADVA